MPFRKSRLQSPVERAADEARLCFAASGGCLAVGSIGWLVNRLAALDTSLPALLVVGCFYGLMGLGCWWRWSRLKSGRTKPSDSSDSGH